MRRSLPCLFSLLLISAVAEPLIAQGGKCSGKGTFARRTSAGDYEYCWHGTHYTESNAPGNVTAFFANVVAKSKASAKQNAGNSLSAPPTRTPTPTRAAPPAPAPRPRPVRRVTARPQPVVTPVGADLVASIEPGTDSEDVLAKLGRPHGSISNLGDDGKQEAWSYQLPGGGMAKVRLDQGKVIAVNLPQ